MESSIHKDHLSVQDTRGNDDDKGSSVIEESVFERFQEGDANAFEVVVSRLNVYTVSYLTAISGRREIAEEIAQEAFLLLYQNRHKIYSARAIQPWLFRTGSRLARREMKRMRHRMEYAVDPVALKNMGGSEQAEQVDDVAEGQRHQVLLAAIATLKPKERELIALRYFSGLKLVEVGEVMKMPTGTVSVKVQRTLKKLRKQLAQSGFDYEDLL